MEFNSACRSCPRLALFLDKVGTEFPTYHARPVASFGSSDVKLLIVGLAPGLHGANATGRPFTGDQSGSLLYETLHKYGYSNQPVSKSAGDGLKLRNCRITNAVKCLPPNNKPTADEIRTCSTYLRSELSELKPGTIVLALGTVAHGAVLRALELRISAHKFGHGNEHLLPGNIWLLDSYHCSRYNTQTKRLTTKMFQDIIKRTKTLS